MKRFGEATPRISVAMCTFNGGKYLDAQLKSIAQQTLPPFELVVCDDGSTDQTREILSQFAQESAFPVQIHTDTERLGVVRNFERAISLCKGEYIALSDQDDFWLPEKLATILDYFAKNPRAVMVFTNAHLTDERLEVKRGSLWESVGFNKRDLELFRQGKGSRVIAGKSIVTGATAVFQSSFRTYFLPFPAAELTLLHDAWMGIVAAAAEGLVALETPLIRYRLHSAQAAGVPAETTQTLSSQFSRSVEEDGAIRQKRFARNALDARVVAQTLDSRSGSEQFLDSGPYLEAAAFYGMRATLPAQKWRRLAPVIRFWRKGSYGQFCTKPLMATLRDILC